jgi:hypothetical protein
MSQTKIRINQTQIDFKDAVVVVTDANIADLAAGAPDIVDGVTLAVGDRVLVNAQTTLSQNGIYEVEVVGTGSNGEWIRVEDMNTGDRVHRGLVTFVTGGTEATKGYMLTSAGIGGVHIVGTDSMSFQPLNDEDSGVSLSQFVFNEVMTGAIGSGNKIFTTATAFATGTLQVFLNGVRQVLGVDYTVTDVDEITFTFAPRTAPGNPDIVTCDYLTT